VLLGGGLWSGIVSRLVRGENVAEALHFVESGAAVLGFVALAQVVGRPSAEVWVVPESLHAAIGQGVVLLATAAEHAGARAYLEFLASDAARACMAQAGYGPTK
jgi:molybdate transport system substrate-binding protein